MPFSHPATPGVPHGPALVRPRLGRPVVLLVLTAVVLAAATAVLGQDAGLVALGLGTVALFAAAVLGLRAQWLAVIHDAGPAAPTGTGAERLPADLTTARLTRLRERYAAAVNKALADGDTLRAHELADAYSDDALRLITG